MYIYREREREISLNMLIIVAATLAYSQCAYMQSSAFHLGRLEPRNRGLS